MSLGLDILAVLEDAGNIAASPGTKAYRLALVHQAFKDLVEADREYDSAKEAMRSAESVSRFSVAVARFEAASVRRCGALMAMGPEPAPVSARPPNGVVLAAERDEASKAWAALNMHQATIARLASYQRLTASMKADRDRAAAGLDEARATLARLLSPARARAISE